MLTRIARTTATGVEMWSLVVRPARKMFDSEMFAATDRSISPVSRVIITARPPMMTGVC